MRQAALGTLLALLLLGSCPAHVPGPWLQTREGTRPPLPIVWHAGCGLPRDVLTVVRSAFTYWDDVVAVDLFREVGCDDEADVTVVVSSDENHSSPSRWADTWLKDTLDGRDVTVVTFYRPFTECGADTDAFRTTVARHEVGHVLGLDHVSDDSCLLYQWIDCPRHGRRDGPRQACPYELTLIHGRYGL